MTCESEIISCILEKNKSINNFYLVPEKIQSVHPTIQNQAVRENFCNGGSLRRELGQLAALFYYIKTYIYEHYLKRKLILTAWNTIFADTETVRLPFHKN